MLHSRFETASRFAAGVVCSALLVAAPPAQAQLRSVHAPEKAGSGTEVTLYATWEGTDPFEGVVVALPSAWEARSARLTAADGRVFALRPRPVADVPGRTAWLPDASHTGSGQIALVVRIGASRDRAAWTITPLKARRERGRTTLSIDHLGRAGGSLQVEPEVRDRTGRHRMLRLGATGGNPEIEGRWLPDLTPGAAFTFETWLRTTAAPAVVMSTWDGDETKDYAAELEIDAFGRPVFYQGIDGRHRAVRGGLPVADGTWHHVAVTHDPERGRTRLFVDGAATDSLLGFVSGDLPRPDRLVLGRRPGRRSGGPVFRGDLDELRIWAVAREPSTVRAGMRLKLPQPPFAALFLGFDEPPGSPGFLEGTERPVSDLVFHEPVTDFRVHFDGTVVRLSWSGSDAAVERYVVESSADGQTWHEVGGLARFVGRPGAQPGERLFEFVEVPGQTRVAWYRLRQELSRGERRFSSAVKVGLGAAPPDFHAALEGNYPNPFNPSTTIRYRVDEPIDLSVSVWDLSGQRVETLASGRHAPGEYSVSFHADDLPSGTYFVRLESAEGVQSGRMVLTR